MERRLSVELNITKQQILIIGGDDKAFEYFSEFSNHQGQIEIVGKLENEKFKTLHNRGKLLYRGLDFYPSMMKNITLVITTVSDIKKHHAIYKAVEHYKVPFYSSHFSELSTVNLNLTLDDKTLSLQAQDQGISEDCMHVLFYTWTEQLGVDFNRLAQMCRVTTPIVNKRLKQPDQKFAFWENMIKKGHVMRAIDDPVIFEELVYAEIAHIDTKAIKDLHVPIPVMAQESRKIERRAH